MQQRQAKLKVTYVTVAERQEAHRPRTTVVGSEVFFELGLLDVHVLEFTGIEDLAALETLDKLAVFIAGDDSNARVLAFTHGNSLSGKLATAGLKFIKPAATSACAAACKIPEICGILSPTYRRCQASRTQINAQVGVPAQLNLEITPH
jgi:hypothetical protein